MPKPFTDEKLKRFLTMYDDKYSYVRIAKISGRNVKDVRRMYDTMFETQCDYIEKHESLYKLPLQCVETGATYSNAKKAAKTLRRSKYILTRSAMFGFKVDKMHYIFIEGQYGE